MPVICVQGAAYLARRYSRYVPLPWRGRLFACQMCTRGCLPATALQPPCSPGRVGLLPVRCVRGAAYLARRYSRHVPLASTPEEPTEIRGLKHITRAKGDNKITCDAYKPPSGGCSLLCLCLCVDLHHRISSKYLINVYMI